MNITNVNQIQSDVVESVRNAYFVVKDDVRDMNGNIIIRKNEPVSALLSVSSRASVGRPGKIVIEFKETKNIWKQPAYFNHAPSVFEGISRRGLVAGLTVGMFFVYAPFNFIHLIHEGEDITIPVGFVFRAGLK